jgi:hypothetical protein
MFTLSEINERTNSYDGSMYSDMHKDVYGYRPRGAQFGSVEEFDAAMAALSVELDRVREEENKQKTEALDRFLQQMEDVQSLILDCSPQRAVEIIAEAEGLSKEDLKFYGWGYLEYKLGINYGSIKTILED